MLYESWEHAPPFWQIPLTLHNEMAKGFVTAGAIVVVAAPVVWQRLPENPVGHLQVERIVQVPPFRQPAVKHD